MMSVTSGTPGATGTRAPIPRILIADDDPDIRDLLQVYLHSEHFEVIAACDGLQALEQFSASHPDLVILDVMMPGMDGMEVCRLIRGLSNVPIVFLTGRDDEVDQLLGFGFGADDYIVKPFSPRTLVARVKALLRRASTSAPVGVTAAAGAVGAAVAAGAGAARAAATGADASMNFAGYDGLADPAGHAGHAGHSGHAGDAAHSINRHVVLSFAELQIDIDAYQVTRFGKTVDLTAKEFLLLKYFAEHPGKALTKRQLVTGAWEEEYFGDDAALMVHLSHLRQKLGDNPDGSPLIVTIRGIGYKFVPPTEGGA